MIGYYRKYGTTFYKEEVEGMQTVSRVSVRVLGQFRTRQKCMTENLLGEKRGRFMEDEMDD